MAAHASVPLGPDAGDLHVLKAGRGEPVEVLLLGREEHPRVGEEARHGEGGMDGAYQACLPACLDYSVRLLNHTHGV